MSTASDVGEKGPIGYYIDKWTYLTIEKIIFFLYFQGAIPLI